MDQVNGPFHGWFWSLVLLLNMAQTWREEGEEGEEEEENEEEEERLPSVSLKRSVEQGFPHWTLDSCGGE